VWVDTFGLRLGLGLGIGLGLVCSVIDRFTAVNIARRLFLRRMIKYFGVPSHTQKFSNENHDKQVDPKLKYATLQ